MLNSFVVSSAGLGFCGCGQPEAAVELVRDVLRAIKTKAEEYRGQRISDPGTYERYEAELNRLLPAPGVQYAILYLLDNAGLTEHGGSVHGSWHTQRGNAFLEALERWGLDSEKWDLEVDDRWKETPTTC